MERNTFAKWWLLLLGALLSAQASFGTGNPILVVGTSSNQFSFYYSEILLAEGINSYDSADVSIVTASMLSSYDVVILGQVALTPAQVTLFSNWVSGGGNLIAMRPDKQLATLLGISDAGSTISSGYLLVNTSGAPGVGIVGQPIQFHGTADLYSLAGASTVATLYTDANSPTPNPAVTLRSGIGSGGSAAAFTYDLAQSIVFTRQGNPAWAGQARVQQGGPIRAVDMFYGPATFDPEPNWVDLNNVAIPQADEQQRLLANIILYLNQSKKPLPRFWYFPFGNKAAVVMTGDDHGSFYTGSATSLRLSDFAAASPAGCSVANWQCVRGTAYLFPQALATNTLTDSQVAAYTAQGFEIGAHVDSNPTCSDWTTSALSSQYTLLLASLATQFPSLPAPQTHRMHCIGWSDYVSQPQVELSNGIRFDTNYYYWPASWVNDTPGLFTGSGMPMRFADLSGNIINVYQAPTQMTDESGQSYPLHINTLLDNALGATGYYGAFVVNAHNDLGSYPGIPGSIITSAQARGVPVVSSLQMLQWLDGRNGSSFGSLSWSGNSLNFTITAASSANGLQAMLPTNSSAGALSSVTQGSNPLTYTLQTIKGVQYAFFPAATGTYQATYAGVLLPVISGVTVTPGTNTATITWTTDRNTNSRVDYGTSPTALTLNSSDGNFVTSHSISLSGLTQGTVYYYRVTSADSSGNSSTSPPTTGSPATFITLNPGALVISGVTAAGDVDGIAHVTWTTNEVATSRVDYGTSPTALTLNVVSPSMVTAHTVNLTGLSGTVAGTTYYYTVTSVDSSGNTVTVPTPPATPNTFVEVAAATVWNPSAAPQVVDSGDTHAVEVGMVFRSDLPGFVTGVRFYKALANTGTQVGNLWSSTGTLLASVNFSTLQGAVGWQQANFAAPVSIAANTTYVISYFAPNGHYAADSQFFASAGVDSPPLHALANGVNGPNGVFQYGATSAFPAKGYNSTNYWVDVVFNENAPPVISAINAGVTPSSATITWTTNVLTNSRVDYGTDPNSLTLNVTNPSMVTSHSLTLPGLLTGTTYYFRVTSVDALGNTATSPAPPNAPATFVPAIVPAPVITAVTATPGSTSALITWTTDLASNSSVNFGTSPTNLTQLASDPMMVTSHTIVLNGLAAATTYYYTVTSVTAAGGSTTAPPAGNSPASFLTNSGSGGGSGNPPSQWDVSGAGDPTIQGFPTDISVNKGGTIAFKINTNSAVYTIDIYRMGYYKGNGASLITSIAPSAPLPQVQPACSNDTTTGLIDCGNWAVSASWTVPSAAVSGIYFAKLTRTDTGGASHIVFVVRDDASTSAIVFQTSDTTWQAYNQYGGNSLYVGNPAGRAYKVSYNRPITTRTTGPEDFIFNAEYPMVRWLEANGYDVTYTTGIDSDRQGALIRNHKLFLSVGHDEYWSGNQRTNLEAARSAGVHLAFFSGNETFWKTRWENSNDGTNTPYRTLVCYKETTANAVIDPLDPPTWTGTWRDPRFSPPADGGRPENGFTGTIFMVNCCNSGMAIQVPAEDGTMRFWRNTGLQNQTPGTTATLTSDTLGYEWDEDLDNGSRPAGMIHLSTAPASVSSFLQDFGSTYAPGYATHNTTLYRTPSGALVFGGGTVQWSWGLDSNHDRGNAPADPRMQQAVVNLFADMGIQPTTLQPGLIPATPSTDTTPPTSVIASPVSGATLPWGAATTITGTATDLGGGVVGGVEVSVDGGQSWHPATGRGSWSYSWTPITSGPATIQVRATDDSLNTQNPATSLSVIVGGALGNADLTWPPTATPTNVATPDSNAVELGMKFRSDSSGQVTGVRFYKGSTNTGTHVGKLWTSTGTLLASVTFSNETASGWQEALFSSPVSISPNTTYVVSYYAPNGNYAADENYFATAGIDAPPIHALANSFDGPNGVYLYATGGGFPVNTYLATNYWVDLVFNPTGPAITSVAANPAEISATITWTTSTASSSRVDYGTTPTSLTSSVSDPTLVTSHSMTISGLSAATPYYYRVTSVDGSSNSSDSPPATGAPATFTTITSNPPVISAVTAVPNIDGAATVQWTTDKPSSSRVDYGTSPTALTLNTSDPTLVTSHAIQLTGLVQGSVYYYRVTSVDAGSNSTTSPPTGSSPAAFTANAIPIWDPATTPVNIDGISTSNTEVGVRFQSSAAGSIVGIRFYKSKANNGTHIGNLWTTAGVNLGTVTFTGESGAGWQQVNFATPIPIAANTTYVASYFAPLGSYSVDAAYFTSAFTNGPLTALQDGTGGANGIFILSGTSAFPTSTSNSSNYWVDVVFAPTTASPSSASLSPASLTFASQLVGTSSAIQIATLTNTGGSPLNLSSITIVGTNSGDFTQTNTCGASLAPNANCNITVTFTPAATGARTATLTITDDAAGSPQTLNLSGTGATSSVSLSPASLTFVNQSVGTSSAAQAVTLTNSGTTVLTLTSITITGTNGGDFSQTNNCGASLAAGANCAINVTFTPTATGARSGTLTITDNAPNGPQTVALTGTGASPAASLSPASLAFGNQPVGVASAAQAVTLTNSGTAALTLTSITFTGTNSGDFSQTNNCGTSLAAGANCAISVTFKPAAAGARSGILTVTDNAPNSPQTVALTGTGAAPAASLSPASLAFGNQPVGVASAAQAVTLTNSGTAALTLTSITFTGTNSGDFSQTNNCGTSLAAGANCAISVTFKPAATGARSGTLTVTDNAPNSPQTAALTGTGTAAAVTLSPTSLAFGNQLVATSSAAKAITLTNSGTAALTLTSITFTGTNSGDFSQTNNCGTSLAAGANCAISVTFKPAATGARSGTLTIADNAPNSPQTAALTGTGTAPAVTLSPTSLAFGNQLVGTSSTAKAITLTNGGTAALTLTSITITGVNSGDYSRTTTCGSSLAAGANCSISVTFTPTATGARSASVTITDNAVNSPQAVALTGTGTAPAVTLSPTSVAFAVTKLGSTSAGTAVTLTNSGTGALSITSITITGTNPADFTRTTTCGASLAAGSSCTITVKFSPQVVGARAAAISVTDNAIGSPQTVSLSGTGTGVTVSPATITFASRTVGTTSAASNVTLTNLGTTALSISSISIAGTNSGDFSQTNTCGSSLARGASCTIGVKFKPTAVGTRTGTLTIRDSDPVSPQTVGLTGTGN
jgi:phosphodiesterase/alkaline phosphatase D-like protein